MNLLWDIFLVKLFFVLFLKLQEKLLMGIIKLNVLIYLVIYFEPNGLMTGGIVNNKESILKRVVELSNVRK